MSLFLWCQYFWTFLNNEAVVLRIKNLNKRNKGVSKVAFVFSTLYTKILHSKLLKVLHEFTDSFMEVRINKSV